MRREQKTVEQSWEDFGKDLCTNPDGTLNIEAIKNEMSDFEFIIGEVPKVYMHITGGTLSKPNYHAEGVISLADEVYTTTRNHEIEYMFEDLSEELSDSTIEIIKKYFNI